MPIEPEQINPYASPAADSDPSFRDMLKDRRAEILSERRRRSAICMLVGCCGVIFSALLSQGIYGRIKFDLSMATSVMLASLGLFFFGQTIWTWIQPIQK